MTAQARFVEFVRRVIPGATAVLVVAGFLYAERIPVLDVESKGVLLLLPAAYIVAVIIAAVVALHHWGTPLREIVRESATAVLLGIGAYGHFLITGGRSARFVILAIVAMLIVMYLREISYAERVGHDEHDVQAFANFSYALHALTTFFLAAFAFALTGLLQTPSWLLAVAGGVIVAFLTAETLRRHAIVPGARIVSLALGLLAFELFWAMTALPTPFVVNAAVFTVFVALAQHVAIRALRSPEPPAGLRRLVFISAILVVALLLTAKWR
jgi:hypothetical protein